VAYLMIPIVLSIMALLLFTLRNQFESDLGSYGSLDEIAKKAHISAEDLKRSAYQGNSFDIGSFDPTIQGMLSKFPQATIAGLFRPFIWEVNNVAMLISGVENTVLLFALIFAIIKARMRLIRIIMTDYFMLFCVVFSVLFAFSIGISTSNFGSLVRFKIPFLPFFTFFLFKVIFDRKN
ncbi:MAG: hypothetical protein MRY83_10200, partial [Flavobacteriales bacterium]|nr:hypothetical protein [Flavobacteriales bacterium]